MIKYGLWLIAGRDDHYPRGSWCVGDGKFAQLGYPHFTTEDINWAYQFREHRAVSFLHYGLDTFEVREYTDKIGEGHNLSKVSNKQ